MRTGQSALRRPSLFYEVWLRLDELGLLQRLLQVREGSVAPG
jgi:hypothetical protein